MDFAPFSGTNRGTTGDCPNRAQYYGQLSALGKGFSRHRGNLQNLAVSEGVVELPHIRLFYLDKSVLSERRFYKQLIHINIILECAILDSPFELTPKIEHLIYSDAFDIRPYSVVLVHDDLFFLLS